MELSPLFDTIWSKIALLGVYLGTSTYGLYQLKSAELLSLPFFVGFVCYAFGFVLWMLILRLLPLSVAFPIAAGGLIMTSQITGYFFLNEEIRSLQWIGLSLLFIGIGLIFYSAAN